VLEVLLQKAKNRVPARQVFTIRPAQTAKASTACLRTKRVDWTTRLLFIGLCVMKGHKQAHLFESDKKKLEAIG
jgi:hypothetical protein